MDKIKEQIQLTNGANLTTTDDVMRQVAELLASLGYVGLGVVLIAPLGEQLNPMNYLPREPGWRLVIVPVKQSE